MQKPLNKSKSKKLSAIIVRLKKEFPEARTALVFSDPLQLLISTILSAQCTDARVNMITPVLYAKYRSIKDFAEADPSDLENDIRSTGFYKMKTRHIIGCCKEIIERFNSKIPKTLEELISLPGVGRKTANCVLGGAFGIQSGIVVDTHVIRLAERFGITKGRDAEKIEADLMKLVPESEWYRLSNLFILHGRKTCKARNPLCSACRLSDICPSYKKLVKLSKERSRIL